MSTHSPRASFASPLVFIVVLALPACTERGLDESLVQVDKPVLITSGPPPEDGFQFDSAWGGVVEEVEGCVTVRTGEYISVLVAPHQSVVVTNPETSELFLRIDESDYAFGRNYKGGGYSVEGVDISRSGFIGVDECIEATGAGALEVIYSIEPV